MREWLARLEDRLSTGGDEELAIALVSLAYAGGERVDLPEDERAGAGRRALLLLATGGDPARGLDLGGRAVTALADELGTDRRRKTVLSGLADLRLQAKGHAHVNEALRALMDDPDLAWRAYAASILAEEMDR